LPWSPFVVMLSAYFAVVSLFIANPLFFGIFFWLSAYLLHLVTVICCIWLQLFVDGFQLFVDGCIGFSFLSLKIIMG
jgi:hypothetical protein